MADDVDDIVHPTEPPEVSFRVALRAVTRDVHAASPLAPVLPHVAIGIAVDVGADEITAGRVNDPLGLTGGARRVKDVEHVLRVHRLGLALAGHVLHQLVIPAIARPDAS
jgi:hypothetical protein